MTTIRRIADTPDAPAPSLLTLLVTDGTSMAAIRGGKDLYWSTHKNRCVDSEGCPHYSDVLRRRLAGSRQSLHRLKRARQR